METELKHLAKDQLYRSFTNPMTTLGDAVLISPKGIVTIVEGYKETPRYSVECLCGTTVRGWDTFYCTNCRRTFELSVAQYLEDFKPHHSYDELYEAFLVSDSENGLGYSQTALDNLIAAVTPETELYSGRAFVKQKKRSWIGKFEYTDIVTAIAVVTFCILLHISHYF